MLSNLGVFVIRIRILCIVHVSCMYLACILMCPVHQDTCKIHRDFEIHQDTFVSVTLAILGNVSYLGYVSFFKIHSEYIQDTFRIQCILTLRYITHRIYIRDTYRIHRNTFEERISIPTCTCTWMRAGRRTHWELPYM